MGLGASPQDAGTIVTEQVLQAMAVMTHDTIVGRVRFDPQQRNVGRDPVLMQQQVCCPDLGPMTSNASELCATGHVYLFAAAVSLS